MTGKRRIAPRIVWLAAGAALLAAVVWLSYPYLETAPLEYDVVGIDVSHHQGRIDWPAVARSGVRFAYLKATEGGDFVDSSFARNWAEARAAGLAVGAYHFYRRCKGGSVQAENFLNTFPPDRDQLPPVIDVEQMDPCADADFDPAVEISVFLDVVQARTGCRPILYVTGEFDAAFLRGKLESEAFWVRSLFLPPPFRRSTWLFWQYHHDGRRPGIVGPVDLNVFRGDLQGLSSLVAAANCFPPRT